MRGWLLRGLGGVALCLAIAAPGFAAVPTHPPNPPGAGGATGAVIPAAPEGTVTICDQMAMVPGGLYTAGNGNAIGGQIPFGSNADLQLADDCVHADDYEITQVCQGSVTFLGAAPAQGVWVQVYADAGGSPANTFTFNEMVPAANVTTTPFVDTVFGLLGVIICADLSPGFIVPAGTWYWNLQPIFTPNGDWYFQVRRTTVAPTGTGSFGKDGGVEHGGAFGGPYPGGYGTTVWVSMAALGFGAGDAAFSVTGQPVIQDADLSVTKVADSNQVAPGDPITYTIVVANAGPDDALGTVVTDTFPAGLTGVTWTCTPTAGSACTPAGAGDINDVADILAGGSVTYTVMATVDPAFSGSISNTVTITPGPNVVDPTPGDNTSTALVGVILNPLEIPTLGTIGLVLLVLVLGAAALVALRRRRTA